MPSHKPILLSFHLLQTYPFHTRSTMLHFVWDIRVRHGTSSHFLMIWRAGAPAATAKQNKVLCHCRIACILFLALCGFRVWKKIVHPSRMPSYAMVRMAVHRNEYTSLLLFWLLAGARCHFRFSSVASSARWAGPRFLAKALARALLLFSRRRFYRIYIYRGEYIYNTYDFK